MHTVFFQLGPWVARSYGVMLAFSFLFGILLACYRAKKSGLDPARVVRLSFYMLIAVLVGARLAYVLVNYQKFMDEPFKIIDFYENGVFRLTGLVMNGGVVAAVITAWIFTRLTKMPVLKTMDVLAPSLALGIFLTRIGCFLNGCCYGLPTSQPWGVVFPAESKAGHYQRHELDALEPIHPTQLYSSFYGLLILLLLLLLEKRYKRFEGFTTLALFILYSAARFTVEFFRHFYDQTGVYLGLTHNQYVSIAVFGAAIAGMVFLSHRHRAAR